MTDPNDFSVSMQDVIAALETNVREGVEQPASVAFFFKPGASGYDLPRAAVSVTRVTSIVRAADASGVVRNRLVTFHPGQYRLDGNRLVWVETRKSELPAEGARFEVEYTYRDLPSGLTDFNPGSVAGTLLRAVAREVTLLYNQMNEAYRRAFIDEAEGAALDNVVALLGVRRNPAQKAAGRVTFFSKKAARQTVVIEPGVKVADQSGRVFVVTGEGGHIPSEAVTEELRGPLQLKNLAAGLVGVWPKGAPETEANDLTKTDGTTRPKAVLDADDRTIKAAGPAPLPEADLVVRYVPRSVTVAVEAAAPGPDGNVNAGAIKIMPDPPPGAEGVTNEAPTSGGAAPETDELLRQRAKHALERGGNATLSAIKYAVLDVDGVSGAEVIDHGTDDSVPLGQVRVRYHGDPRVREKVSRAVEQTRAAGVMVQLDEIVVVLVSGTFYLIPEGPVPAGGAAKFEAVVKDAVEALPIGAPLAARRLNSLAFNIPGIADVAEAKLTARRAGVPLPMTDPLPVGRGEMVRPDKANIRAIFLVRLEWAADRYEAAGGGRHVVEIQIIDENGAAAVFNNFALDLQVMVRAGLKNAPDQPPERVNTFTSRVTFAGASKALLEIRRVDLTRADLTGFDPNVHRPEVEFVIAAAAYPGLVRIQKTLDVRQLFGL